MRFLFIFFAAFISLNSISQEHNLEEHAKEHFASYDFPKNMEVAIGYISDGSVQKPFGFIKKRKWKELDNSQHIFEIGSISKVFTSYLLSTACELKMIDLNDTIQKEWKEISWNDTTPITYKMLANHTSGLPRLPGNWMISMAENPSNPYSSYDERTLLSYLENDMKLATDPGSSYAYSNLGAALLGYLICRKMNMSYEAALQRFLFEKLSMSSSSIHREQLNEKNLVVGLDPSGNEMGYWDFDVLAGAGAVKSNVEDMLLFMENQLNDSSERIELMQDRTYEGKEINLALGWHLIKEDMFLWHNGATGGFRSSLILDRETKNGLIILTNISSLHPKAGTIDKLVVELIEMLNESIK